MKRRLIEKGLLLAGLLAVLAGGSQLRRFEAFQTAHKSGASGDVVGRLEIPRLHLSVPILDNDDPNSLALSVGHIRGTSVIGSLGNAGIAGHRDTAFRPLSDIRIGDRIETHTAHDALYIVKSFQVVEPNDTRLLRESTSPMLTLVTCYPFHYVGSAPHRFVIQAELALNHDDSNHPTK